MEDSNPVVYLQLDTDLYTNNYHPFKIRMLEKTLRFSPFFCRGEFRIGCEAGRGMPRHPSLGQGGRGGGGKGYSRRSIVDAEDWKRWCAQFGGVERGQG